MEVLISNEFREGFIEDVTVEQDHRFHGIRKDDKQKKESVRSENS